MNGKRAKALRREARAQANPEVTMMHLNGRKRGHQNAFWPEGAVRTVLTQLKKESKNG